MYKVRMPQGTVQFGNLLEGLFNNDFKNGEFANTHSASVNIRENADQYEMQLIAPGLKKEDFKISVEKNTFTVSFDQKEEAKEESEKWIRQEFKLRSFKRSFTLNDKVDVAAINATYDNGILTVSLPKKEKEEPKTVSIAVQ